MNTDAIKRYIDRVRQTARSRGKSVNLTLEEAQDLSNCMTLLLLRENELLVEISRLKSESAMTEIVVNGGSFK